jgi:hypothetical protein
VEDESFVFFAPAKMRGDPRWVDVTSLFINGLEPEIEKLNKHPATQPKIVTYMTRLAHLKGLLDREFHAEKITGADKGVDVVVDIFNRVNSGGTKLSKGDLALAKICAQWPEARSTMRGHLARWRGAGYAFALEWLLRNVNAVATGRAPFSALDDISPQQFQQALELSARYIGGFLDRVSGRLGLDHDRVLMGRYAFPVVSRFLHLSGGRFDKLCLPAMDERALHGLKFSAALPPRLAEATLAAPLADLEGATTVLKEPTHFSST